MKALQPSELRIGNSLIDKISGELLIVSELSETGFTAKVADRSKYPLPDGWQAEPIPLNEEWLIKFGFVVDKGVYKVGIYQGQEYIRARIDHKEMQNCTIEWDNFRKECYLEFEGCKNSCSIRHVHQLQNLYFSLTGEELTINP
jgi:hypothetical protein